MISPQHLINTGICGLFCVTLFSLAAIKSPAKPSVATQPVSIGQDYTLHIKTSNVQQRISSSDWMHEVQDPRSLAQRNQHARAKRAQFEQLFTRSPDAGDKKREDSSAEILRRARNAVYHGMEAGKDESSSR